jgi:hypothetical protein
LPGRQALTRGRAIAVSGSTVDFIVLPLVMIPVLGAWLFAVYHANSHPGVFEHVPSLDEIQADTEIRSAPPGEVMSGQSSADDR